MSTKLLYLENMHDLTCTAYVDRVEQKDGRSVVYLDQTIFYPQGGGQPYDTGTIETEDTKFNVEEGRFIEGEVLHIGYFEGRPFIQGEDVHCQIDAERRQLHKRLHSAGHVLDMAVTKLGYDWIPGKGYHFPDGPYVEYAGSLEGLDKDEVISQLNKTMADLIASNPTTEVKFVTLEELHKLCRHVPDNLPVGKPIRAVMYGDFAVPCGGTHVAALKDIGRVHIRKIKGGDVIKISYEIS